MERWNIRSLKLEREKEEETIRSTKTFTRNVQGTYHESGFAMHDTNAILRIFSVISSSSIALFQPPSQDVEVCWVGLQKNDRAWR
jgi:hypothetical protein